ncbi:prepilin-type N-terminal cleavage/methylation domain-containing protein [Candidatus Marinimicrobia bacterium MT.SAG.4]|nr:prepilin-type N-terminal cleavage/methylation domain-containing protein [Candidatus Marinimicrobia bacterium MT.SAG.4]
MIFLSRRRDGFTLMELIVVMALLGILTSVGINIVLRTLEAQKADSTLLEMETIKRAIAGDPSLIINGRRADFGYYGDMGIMPATLTDLITQGSQPALTNDTTYFIIYGWGGPYLSKSFEGESNTAIEDSWRNAYIYSNSKTINASGDSVYGIITSLGANGVGGGEGYDADIDLEILKREVVSTVYGSAYTIDGNPMVSGKVYLRKPNGTASLKIVSVVTGLQGTYSFSGVSRGARTLSFKAVGGIETNIKSILVAESAVAVPRVSSISNLIFVSGSATVLGSSDEQVQFQLRNLLGQSITITDYRADYPGSYNPTTGPKFNQLNVNAVTVFSEAQFANMAGSAEQIDFKGSGMANFILPNSQTRTFLMSGFQDNSAVLQDMTGTNFTVILYSSDGKQYSFDFSL